MGYLLSGGVVVEDTTCDDDGGPCLLTHPVANRATESVSPAKNR